MGVKFRGRVPSPAPGDEDPRLLDVVPWPVVDATLDPVFDHGLKDGEGAAPDQLTVDSVPKDPLAAFLSEEAPTEQVAPSKREPGAAIRDVAPPPRFRWWAGLIFAGTAAIVAIAVVKLVERSVRQPQAPSRVAAPAIPVAPPERQPPTSPRPGPTSQETPVATPQATAVAKAEETPVAKSQGTPIVKSHETPVAKSEAARVGKSVAPSQPALRAADSSASAPARAEPTKAPTSPEPVPSSAMFPNTGSAPIVLPPAVTPLPLPPTVENEISAVRVDNRVAIQHVLDAYKQSYNRLDAVSVSEIWRGLDTRALARAFTALSSQDLSFDHCDVKIGGTRATALCSGALRYVRRVGDPAERVRYLSWTFNFVRNADRWVIANVTAQ